ncbi:unnamed protein product [Thelazia callipaeda]|uniref:RRN7-type domain-containing protein n=1 Tax=Thelazia callipaeda TaxID=103827 RepID=A0A0N5CYW5_THECL|nr:unnamed protein product [Thelazia callipaeda]
MAECCGSCGSTDFSIADGYFYCSLCNTQSQALREFDHEDEGVLANALGTRVRTGKKKQAVGRKKVLLEEKTSNFDRSLPALRHKDFPEFLGFCGLRLATFTKLLARFSTILIHDFDVPESIRAHVLYIIQRYLQHCRVAFCMEELDEENSYCPLLNSSRSNYGHVNHNDSWLYSDSQNKTREMELEIRKEMQINRGKSIMSLLVNDDIDANFHSQVAEKNMGNISSVTKVETKLSATAVCTVRSLFQNPLFELLDIPLSSEIIMAVLYVGCLLSGATWVLLSDITRWFREGRFFMSALHSSALCTAIRGNNAQDSKRMPFSIKMPIMPLFEYMRTVVVLSQLSDIPVQPISCSFDRILARLSYNLNLPIDFMERLYAISAIFPPNIIFDAEFTRQFNIVDLQALLEKKNNVHNENISFALEPHAFSWVHGCERAFSIIPTADVKAVVTILLALKLIFGLDDNMEYNMETRVDAERSNNDDSFNFGEWIHQLRMRMQIWRGRPLKDVTYQPHFFAPINYQSKTVFRSAPLMNYEAESEKFNALKSLKNFWGEQVTQINVGRFVGGRNLRFKGCVPDHFVMDESDYSLYSSFEDDCDSKYMQSLDKEALLSKYNVETFFKSFKNHRMEYKAVKTFKNKSVQPSESSFSSDWVRKKWRHLFPCSKNYEAYPKPLYSPALLKYTKELVYTPMIYTPAVNIIFQNASPYFSESFHDLLHILSVMIGEDIKTVYAFFLMLETKLLLHKSLNDIKEISQHCKKFCTSAQIEMFNDQPRNVKVELCRINENVRQQDFRFEVSFHYF